jgi:hypothetical protein
MAVKKKATKRKTGAKKRKARVGVAAAPKSRIKIGALNFTKSSCHSTKTDAKKRADGVRARGTRARVIKNGKAYCVYTGGKSRTLARRRAA